MKNKLRNFRKEHNIKVSEILKVMNTKYPITYYRKENGERKFTAEEVILLSNTFKIPKEFFLNDK